MSVLLNMNSAVIKELYVKSIIVKQESNISAATACPFLPVLPLMQLENVSGTEVEDGFHIDKEKCPREGPV